MPTRVSPASYAFSSSARVRAVFTIERLLDFGFSLLYVILTIRFVLAFFEANRAATFYGFVVSISEPVFAPFRGLFGTTMLGSHPVVWGLLAALLAVAVLHGLVRGVVRLFLPVGA